MNRWTCIAMIPLVMLSGCSNPTATETAGAWLRAVETANPEALALADTLTNGLTLPTIPDAVRNMVAAVDLNESYLTDGFTEWDLQAWHSAAFMQRQARKIVEARRPDQSEIDALFHAVSTRLAETDPISSKPRWPLTIWELKAGLCDRQAWVLCELAYQLGYETQIVYLGQADGGPSPHTICEIRSSSGQVWMADPLSEKLLPEISVATLVRQPELTQELWPDKPIWQQAVAGSVLWTPAMPQDYCPRNQLLHQALAAQLGADCPRFGDSPPERLRRYRELVPKTDRDLPMGFWNHPFKLLLAEFTLKKMRQP